MQQIIDEYGEAIIGVIVAFIIIGMGLVLFQDDGALARFISEMANKSV